MTIGMWDANRSLSDSWKRITKYTLLKEKPPKGYMWFLSETDKKSSKLPDLRMCGLKFGPKWVNPLEREREARKGKRETQAR